MITTQANSFNLIDEPWIRVRKTNGDICEVNLRELFSQSSCIEDLAGDSPTQNYAVFRVLEAILIRAVSQTNPWGIYPELSPEKLWEMLHQLPNLGVLVIPYLDRWKSRFDLFDCHAPFFQVANLETEKGEYDGASRIVPDVDPSNFSTSTQRYVNDNLTFPEAARWLIYVQAYEPSGIKSGAKGDPRVKGGKGYPIGTGYAGATGAVQIVGQNLSETLLLNFPYAVVADSEKSFAKDLPPWERNPDGAAPRFNEEVSPRGVVDALTWQQRRVRLWGRPNGTIANALVANGDKVKLSNNFTDPYTAYRFSKEQSKKGSVVRYPRKHDPARLVWRGLQSMFVKDRPSLSSDGKSTDASNDLAVPLLEQYENALAEQLYAEAQGGSTVWEYAGLRLIGIEYGTQDSVITAEISETIQVDPVLLTARGKEIRQAMLSAIELVFVFQAYFLRYLRKLAVAAGGTTEAVFEEPVLGWLSELETEFRRWVAQLSTNNIQNSTSSDPLTQWRKTFAVITRTHIDAAAMAAGRRAAIGRLGEANAGGVRSLSSTARHQLEILKILKELTDPVT